MTREEPTPPLPPELESRRREMFPTLTPEQIRRIATCGGEQTFAAGTTVWEQGDPDVPFYVVVEGELEVDHPCEEGGHELIVVHGPGQFTGEINVLMNRRALVRGRAATPLRVIRVERARFRTLFQNDPELSELIMRAYILRRVGLMTAGQGDVVIIGSRESASTLRLQEFLVRNAHPYRYLDVDRDAHVQSLLDELHLTAKDIPVLVCPSRSFLRNPTEAQVASCLGFVPRLEYRKVHDLVICGAGPGGLAAAVYGASEGLDVLVVEAHAPGGQAASSSKIENYLGFPTGITGQALAGRALAQAEKFGASLAVTRGAMRLVDDEGSIRIELDGAACVRARAVVIATGAEYRKLDVPDLMRFEGAGIYYAATSIESTRCTGDDVIVVGGGNSAGQAATFLARSSRHVHVLIRGPDLASSMSWYLVRRIGETPNITLHRCTQIVGLHGGSEPGSHLEAVTWKNLRSGEESTHPIRHVFSMAGAKPNTEWLRGCLAMDERGFIETGADLTDVMLASAHWALPREPYLFETSHPHIFAIGDVRANSVKRVASAVGEGSVCIQLVHRILSE